MNDIKAPRRGERVTIRTVAAQAGVSVAAVSKVLRNAYGVSDSLRLKVQTAIDALGYRPSVAARGMRGQTYMIGILLVEIANPFIPEVVDGINGVLAPSNYKALMGMGQSATAIEVSLIESMIDNRMDGLILVAPRMAGETLARFARQIPMVAVGHHEASAAEFDTVNSDDQRGVAIALEALHGAGHEDIMMISLQVEDATAANVVWQREAGYLAAMTALGLQRFARIHRLGWDATSHGAEIEALLAGGHLPRAVFVWSDLDGVILINAAKMRGIRVPEDLAIIGYDNSRVAALPLVNLSSIDQQGRHLGALATEMLLSRIGGRTQARHVLVEPSLVRRTSG
ncbi:MAG: LacI family DNA-binding transcriptional regulator [bacterium]